MTEIHCPADFGHAPARRILRDFNVAVARADIPAVVQWLGEDVVWEKVGGPVMRGVEAVEAELAWCGEPPATRLDIHELITHGRSAAASGELLMPDGRRISFCDVYRLGTGRTPRIRRITSWCIALMVDVDREAVA